MSRHSAHCSSSAGPPIESRIVLRGDANQFVPSSHPDAYQHQDVRSLNLLPNHVTEQAYVSPRIPHPNYGYYAGQAMGYAPVDVFYSQQYYMPQAGYGVPPQQNFRGTNYPEWSSPDMPNSPTDMEGRTNHTSSGKSRRFSKRRNVKEGEDNRTRPFHSPRPQQNANSKVEVRFSHQKKENEETTDQIASSLDNTGTDIATNEDESDKVKKQLEVSKKSVLKKQLKKVEPKQSFIKKRKEKPMKESSETQLGVLIDQLTSGTYECMVCCDRVKQQHAVWNCNNCFHVFHMVCIKKWARSPSAHVDDGGWRCPGCQNVNKKFPSLYKCYCGKVREPEWNRRETPHSCGEVCGKKRSHNATCTHPCNILCHPGPCPPCPASVIKSCLCGNISKKVRCSQQKALMCEEMCGKIKNCSKHKCDIVCHSGDCNECRILIEQSCFCRKNQRQVLCGSIDSNLVADEDSGGVYLCEKFCGRDLSCGNHRCEQRCHPGPCPSCPLMPENLKTCPCTRSKLSDLRDFDGNILERKACTDPIPTCGETCGKPLTCGGDSVHMCKLTCHSGPCPPCIDNESVIHCRCGKSEMEVPCTEIPEESYVCDRRCNKKRKCGRHKCGKICCTDDEHICTQICGRKLECKLHRCEDTCHRGNCHACYNVSFEELTCHCGVEVLFPPIPCGTKPPECQKLCARQHSCYHPVNHNCHNEDKCPPCVVLMKKPCNCGKILRSNIPCHQANVSCGAPCKKPLPCGHSCLKLCHPGSCMDGEICTQPCSIMRVECIHPCAMPCHHGSACPQSRCKALVTLKCVCGNRQQQVECSESEAMLQRLSCESLARQHTSIDIRGLFKTSDGKPALTCNDDCSTLERNRKLAEAFEIKAKLQEPEQPNYSLFLQNWVKKDPGFVQWIEQEITNLIDAVSWLDQTKRSFSFPSMKREKRQVVHELAEVMNCKSVSVDDEPNRNVVVTAIRGMSKIPRTLLCDSLKNKVRTTGFLKAAPADSAADKSSVLGHQKRLLSTMKLVSLSSSAEGASGTSQLSRRPASIPKMPSHNAPIPPKATSVGTTYSPMGRMYGNPSSAVGNSLPKAPQKHGTDNSDVKSNGKADKKETEIDYFDMIE